MSFEFPHYLAPFWSRCRGVIYYFADTFGSVAKGIALAGESIEEMISNWRYENFSKYRII